MKRSKHNLSSTMLLTCDMGELIPCGLLEVLPGDSVQMATSVLLRCQALLAPVMHPVHVRVHHWFVPHRLVWDNWEKFITGGPDGLDNSVFPTQTNASGVAVGSLGDYLGIPTSVANITYSALPHRGYGLIWNEWYRDQDLQAPLTISTGDGNDTTTNVTLQNCDWEKDYFTTARPWEVKGPTVSIPVLGTAPVKGIGTTGAFGGSLASVRETAGVTRTYANQIGSSAGDIRMEGTAVGAAGFPSVFADLSAATGLTVNQLRQSLALQRFEEARARYGSRYTEYLASLGVRSSDARLQRPEYLGGGKQTIQFSEVLQTGPDPSSGTGVAQMKGHGITALRSNRFRRFFEEHGYIHTLVSVRPKTIYGNGLFRHWNRRTKYDFWQRELQHIGQQTILNKEVYAAHGTPDGTFGYQDRYDEYRRQESRIAGEFRTTVMDFWHMARIFASAPALNSSFVSCVPAERSFAVPANDVLLLNCRHSIQARRLVAREGTSATF